MLSSIRRVGRRVSSDTNPATSFACAFERVCATACMSRPPVSSGRPPRTDCRNLSNCVSTYQYGSAAMDGVFRSVRPSPLAPWQFPQIDAKVAWPALDFDAVGGRRSSPARNAVNTTRLRPDKSAIRTEFIIASLDRLRLHTDSIPNRIGQKWTYRGQYRKRTCTPLGVKYGVDGPWLLKSD